MPIKDLIQRLLQRLRALFSGRPASAALESPPPRAALPTATASAASQATAAADDSASEVAITIAAEEDATTPAASARADAAPSAAAARVAVQAPGAESGADATPPTPLRREGRADAALPATTPEEDAPQRRPRLRLVEDRRPPKARRRPLPALDPAIAAVPVRRFFSRLVARDAAPLTAASWPSLQVERFFLALAEPSPAIRRGPAIAEPKVLEEAFADFVWE